MAFNDRLKEARLTKGYTQEQLAELIGVAKSTYTGYEKGNREPNMLTISKLLKALGVDANYLWQDEDTFPFELTYDEMENLVKRYRKLDKHGIEMVNFVLEKEYNRTVSENKKVVSINDQKISYANAAHELPNASTEDKKHDDDIMDDDNF